MVEVEEAVAALDQVITTVVQAMVIVMEIDVVPPTAVVHQVGWPLVYSVASFGVSSMLCYARMERVTAAVRKMARDLIIKTQLKEMI